MCHLTHTSRIKSNTRANGLAPKAARFGTAAPPGAMHMCTLAQAVVLLTSSSVWTSVRGALYPHEQNCVRLILVAVGDHASMQLHLHSQCLTRYFTSDFCGPMLCIQDGSPTMIRRPATEPS